MLCIYLILHALLVIASCSEKNMRLQIKIMVLDRAEGIVRKIVDPVEPYVYKYSNKEVVHFVCQKVNKEVENSTLLWHFDVPKGKETNWRSKSCSSKQVNEINYITQLDSLQNGNNLSCFLKNNHSTLYAAHVFLRCDDCTDYAYARYSNEGHFNLNCRRFNATPLVTYVNGEYSSATFRIVEFIENQRIVIHCELEANGENDYLEWNWMNSGIVVEGYGYNSKNIIGIMMYMTENMDNKEVGCLGGYSSDEELIKKSITFKLKSDFFIDIIHWHLETRQFSFWNSYRQYSELRYKNNDSICLRCRFNLNEMKKNEFYKNKQRVQSVNIRNNIIQYFMYNLTESDNGTVILCRGNRTAGGSNVRDRYITFRFQQPEHVISPYKSACDKSALYVYVGVAVLIVIIQIVCIVMYKRRGTCIHNSPITSKHRSQLPLPPETSTPDPNISRLNNVTDEHKNEESDYEKIVHVPRKENLHYDYVYT